MPPRTTIIVGQRVRNNVYRSRAARHASRFNGYLRSDKPFIRLYANLEQAGTKIRDRNGNTIVLDDGIYLELKVDHPDVTDRESWYKTYREYRNLLRVDNVDVYMYTNNVQRFVP